MQVFLGTHADDADFDHGVLLVVSSIVPRVL